MEEEVFSNALPNYEFKEENKYENQELIKGIAINPMIRENFNSIEKEKQENYYHGGIILLLYLKN